MKEIKNRTFLVGTCILVILIVIFTVFAINRRVAPPRMIKTNLHKPFDAKATIKMKDLVMEVDINKTDIGACTIKIKEPKQLKDMVFQYDGNDVKVSYKGLSVKLDENSKLVSSIASIIVKSIDTAASPSGIDVQIEGKTLLVKGENESGKFEILLDKQSGSMMSLKQPGLDFECNFSDFVFSKK